MLYELAYILNECDQIEPALARTVPLLVEQLDLRTAWVWLLQNTWFYCAYAHNLPSSLQAPVEMTGEPCWCIEAYQRGTLRPANLACSRLRKVGADLREHASIPLASGGRILGILNLAGRPLDSNELRLLETFGLHLGTTLERIYLAQESARLARSQERERVARELHDTLTQNLTGLTLQLEAALRRPSPSVIGTALEIARESLESVRETLVGLRCPQPLDQALREWVHNFSARTGVRVDLEVLSEELEPALEIELLRLAQEALQNVARHSGAARANLTLRRRGQGLELRCWDEGRGIEARAGLGLTGMRERVALLGGKMTVRKRPEGGTSVEIRL